MPSAVCTWRFPFLLPGATIGADVVQAQLLIHRVSQFLFASEILLGSLNRWVPKQKLNLFQFTAIQVA
jgi:hypothetical protein